MAVIEVVTREEAERIAKKAGVSPEKVMSLLTSVNHFIRIQIGSNFEVRIAFKQMGIFKKVPRGLERMKFKRNGRPRTL